MNKIEKSRIEEIRRLHDEIFGSFKISLEKAIRFGQLLNEQKDKLQHGEFTTWVDDNLPFAERTAQNYMRVYRERDKFKTETVSDLTSAYKLLIEHKDTKETRPSVPSTAMDVSRKEAEYRDHVDKAVFYSDELRVDVTTKNSESEFLKDADWMVLGVEGSPDTNNFPKDSKLFFRERKNEDRAFVEKKGV